MYLFISTELKEDKKGVDRKKGPKQNSVLLMQEIFFTRIQKSLFPKLIVNTIPY